MNLTEISFQDQLNIMSQELFGKNNNDLNSTEKMLVNAYINALLFPTWKEITRDERRINYEVSNTGLIRDSKTGKLMNQYTNKKGYMIASIKIGNEWETIIVHRLVAIAFIPNPENKPQVNHINGKKHINWVGNLEWNTAQENITHAVENGLQDHPLGENANHNKYTDKQIHAVCKLLEENKLLNVEIARITGVDEWSISKIKCKQDWTHISKIYNIPTPKFNAVGSDAAASKYTDKDIHMVCSLLTNPKNTMTYISSISHVGYDMVYRIKKGLNWRHISSQYDIPGLSKLD